MSDKKQNWPNEARQDLGLKELESAIKSRERKAKAAPLGVIFATLAVLVLAVGGIWFAATYQSNDEDNVAESASETAEPEIDAAAMPKAPLQPYGNTVQCTYVPDASAKPAREVQPPNGKDIPATGNETVTLTTGDGDIPIKLDNSLSPCTTNSFTSLVKQGFYKDTVCHRGVKTPNMTLLQCGDPTGSGSGGPGYTFGDEFPLNGSNPADKEKPVNYARGTLAMANSGENTNGSQFFLVTKDTTLPPKYNVFGTISDEGLKTLDKIGDEKVGDGDAAPTSEVKITDAKVA